MKKLFALTLLSAAVMVGCSSDDDAEEAPEGNGGNGGNGGTPPAVVIDDASITAAVRASTDFTSLSSALDAAGLADDLGGATGTLTVFAPNDTAFMSIDASELASLLGNPDDGQLANILTYHVVSSAELSQADLLAQVAADDDGTVEIASMQGDMLMISSQDGNTDGDDDETTAPEDRVLTVNGIAVVAENTDPANGTILVLNDGVLMPTTEPAPGNGGGMTPGGNGGGEMTPGGSSEDPSLAAVRAAGNSDFADLFGLGTLGSAVQDNAWTVFAPNNDAIDDGLLSSDAATADDIAKDHILTEGALDAATLQSGGDLTTNGGVTVTFGTNASGGLTVNGFNATEITTPGASTVYSIDGVLQ